jgi:geranylgeranyl diphosphate synthase type I
MSVSLLQLHDAPVSPRKPRGLWSEEGLDQVEAIMLGLCSGERLDRLGSILWEHVGAGGKRLRARLALAAVEALGAPRESGLAWAAACELLHNATLVHDDLQDGDRYRRGREAVWARHGTAQAINAGDLALMLPYVALEQAPVEDGARWRLARALAGSAEEVVRGQAAEMDLLHRGHLSWDAYARAVEGKTAALFGLPVEGAAILAGWRPDQARELGGVFRRLGVLFQVQDDVLDLWGDKGRGETGSDLREGKVSALVVEHLRLHPEDQAWLTRILATPREKTREADVQEAIRRFAEGGALRAVWARMEQLQDDIHVAPTLADAPRLHAVALALIGQALAPIAHTHPAPPTGGLG